MLEDQDYQEIAHIFKVILESDIGPKINRLAEGQQLLLETLAPKNRVEELEDEVSFLKSVIRMHSEQIAELKSLVVSIDPDAFIVVQEAHQVLGEGFARYSKNSL